MEMVFFLLTLFILWIAESVHNLIKSTDLRNQNLSTREYANRFSPKTWHTLSLRNNNLISLIK